MNRDCFACIEPQQQDSYVDHAEADQQVAWKDSQSVFRCRFYQSYKNDAKKKN